MHAKNVESFRDLIVWQKSHELVQNIYKITEKFPKRERLALAQQLREAAIQLPINISLGFHKRGRKTKIHYYRTALSSIEGIRYLVILAADLDHYKNEQNDIELCETIERMLKRLVRSVSSS
jgi:four helix bundle protein